MTAPAGLGPQSSAVSGPTGCSRLTGIAQGILTWLASAPSSPRILRPGAIEQPWAGVRINPYPMAAPPWTALRWGGAEAFWILSILLNLLPFYL